MITWPGLQGRRKFSMVTILFVAGFSLISFSDKLVAQTAEEKAAIETIIDGLNLPIKKSDQISIMDVRLKDTKLIYISLYADELANIVENLSKEEIQAAFKPDAESICSQTQNIRSLYEWLEVVHLHFNREKKLLFKFSTKDGCAEIGSDPLALNKEEIENQLRTLRQSLPLNFGKGLALMDVFFDGETKIIYQFQLTDKALADFGDQLIAFRTSYLKGVCNKQSRQAAQKSWLPLRYAEELLGKDGKELLRFTFDEVC